MNQAAISWLNPNLAAARGGKPRDEDHAEAKSTEVTAWPTSDDVYFQAIAGDVRKAPGANGTEDVTGVVQRVLDRVRRNIRERSNGKSEANGK